MELNVEVEAGGVLFGSPVSIKGVLSSPVVTWSALVKQYEVRSAV